MTRCGVGLVVLVAGIALWAGNLSGQSPGLAPLAPPASTAPAVDLSSPKATLTSLFTAMRNGDVAAAKACMHFADAQQGELFELNFTQMYGPMKLMRAMEAKYGPAGKKPFANATLETTVNRVLEHLKTAEFEMEGAHAKVSQKKAEVNPSAENELTGITLTKEGDKWKVTAGTLSDLASDLPADQVRTMRVLKMAVESACTDTIAHLDQYPTADRAYADYQLRVQAATQAAARGN